MDNFPQKILHEYLDWFREELSVRTVNEAVELTTPFLDPQNDHLQIYAMKIGSRVVLSDAGRTLRDLELSGVKLNTPKREEIAQTILNGTSTTLRSGRIETDVEHGNIGQKVQFLLQAILSISDMHMLSQEKVEKIFREDVERLFQENEISYESDVSLEGRSGYSHQIDFVIPPSNGGPVRFVEAMDTPSKDNVRQYLWALSDTELSRPEESRPYAFLNDRTTKVTESVYEALVSYSVQPVPWSERDMAIEELRN